ncbi:hypothetical protein K661_01279, partial [Piscirickettsia salmonis LF-89 = ATCC VR-1361]
QLRSAKNPNLPRPTHPVLSTPWLAAVEAAHTLIENMQAAPDQREDLDKLIYN